MKLLNLSLTLFVLSFNQFASASTTANYYRVWQGFKQPDLTTSQFLSRLPEFMNATTQVYGNVLNQYQVAVPPETKPQFVPDEFALISLPDEAIYREIRATPQGTAYAESHWQIFDKTNSKSAPLDIVVPEILESGHAYNVLNARNDWSSGTTTFFLGLRKSGQNPQQFLKKLSEHILLVAKTLKPLGLKGYIIIADENYEAAYMNWTSPEEMNQAFTLAQGKAVATEASTFLNTLQWTPEISFNGKHVSPGQFYKAIY